MDKSSSPAQLLRQSIDNLERISDRSSGYWPFASPAPCSTESRLKGNVLQALNCLRSALADHESLFHDSPGTDIPATTIIQVK